MHLIKLQCPGCRAINNILLIKKNKSYNCRQCNLELLEDKIIFGFVYILSNETMPGLVKIGFSTRPMEERLKELNSQTGVPYPFTIEAYFGSEKPEDDEKIIHKELEKFRIERKEFFKITTAEVVENIERIIGSIPIYVFSSEVHSGKVNILSSKESSVEENTENSESYSEYRNPIKSLREIMKERAEKHYEDGLREKNPKMADYKMQMAADLGDQRAKFWIVKKRG